MATDAAIRIVIVDDETMFRDALKWLIDAEGDLSTAGETGDPAEAVRLVESLAPDVVLLDLSRAGDRLDDLKGILSAGSDRTRVIVLSGSDDTDVTLRAVQAGAFGVVPKAADTGVLFESVRSVAQGQYWLGDRSVADVIKAMQELSRRMPRKPAHPFRLTPRELEVVAFVTDGYSNKDIAARCVVREDTVKHHLSSIFAKVGVRSRLELAMFAIQNGLVEPRDPAS
jgi:two-component system, NarL family, nitrate/nitrite response regulator NarL